MIRIPVGVDRARFARPRSSQLVCAITVVAQQDACVFSRDCAGFQSVREPFQEQCRTRRGQFVSRRTAAYRQGVERQAGQTILLDQGLLPRGRPGHATAWRAVSVATRSFAITRSAALSSWRSRAPVRCRRCRLRAFRLRGRRGAEFGCGMRDRRLTPDSCAAAFVFTVVRRFIDSFPSLRSGPGRRLIASAPFVPCVSRTQSGFRTGRGLTSPRSRHCRVARWLWSSAAASSGKGWVLAMLASVAALPAAARGCGPARAARPCRRRLPAHYDRHRNAAMPRTYGENK